MPIAQTRLETLQICKLLQCVREGDRTQIEKLTINGVPHLINYNEPIDGETALNIAAIANDDTMIEFLLELGAHPDVVDFKGRSAVMRAAEYGHVQCVEKLAKRGADMKLTDLEGKGILFYCISATERHSKCMEIVLTYGADVNNKTKDGIPVFLKACETALENEDMCLGMLKKGADPNSKQEKTNKTALMAASASGSAKVVREILERAGDINQLMVRSKTHAAHFAAKGGFFDVLVVMAAYGANFDQYDDQLNNPVHIGSIHGHANCCKFLIQRGCNPKPKNNDGEVPKNLAKDGGHKEAMKEIKKAEKSFGKVGKNNDPWALALYDFCTERHNRLLEMFKKFDADAVGFISRDDFIEGLQNMGAPIPEDSDLQKTLALHDKNKDSTVDYFEFLTGKKYINKLYLMSAFEGKKKKGKKGGKGKKGKGKTKIAMPICTQAEGPRAEDGGPPEGFVAQHIHYTDTGRFDRDAPPKHPLQDDSGWYLHHPERMYIHINNAVKHSNKDTLNDAINMGIHIDVKDKYFKTPLMIACSYGNIDMVKFLVESGANVNAVDNFKWSPLHFACHAGMVDVVEYLLNNGANLEAMTANGGTPLMRAIESSKPTLVQFLLNKGAKVQVENKKGQTTVDIAAAWADLRVYDIIKTKWDSLPPMSDKNKKGGKSGGKGGKRPNSGADTEGGRGGKTPYHGRVRMRKTRLVGFSSTYLCSFVVRDTEKPTGWAPSGEDPAGGRADSPGMLEALNRNRKGSILRAASALAGGIEEKEDITHMPIKVWTEQATTKDLICRREVRRDRYTWEVDFPDFEMPFLKNVSNKMEEMGGPDDDDD